MSDFVFSQHRVAPSGDQHVITTVQDTAHGTVGPEQNKQTKIC